MPKIVALLIFLPLLSAAAIAQQRDGTLQRLTEDISTSVSDVTEWYDVPVVLLFLARNSYKADNPSTKIISLPPLSFERELATQFPATSSASPGSMDSWLLPNLIFTSRLLYAVGNNLTGEADMRNTYAHAWTFYKVLMYNHIATELIKNTVRRSRPDETDTKSFFSGHTSTAFATSSFLAREISDAIAGWDAVQDDGTLRISLQSATYVLLYGWAGYVGYSRMADNKHYLTDVLVGALVGSLVGNLLYDAYFTGEGVAGLPQIGAGVVGEQPAITLLYRF